MSQVNEGLSGAGSSTRTYLAQLEETLAAAQTLLSQSPYLPLRLLRCDFHEGVLAVRGRVPTFYLKQLAQTVVSRVPGVEQVANRVEVIPPGQPLPNRQEPTVEMHYPALGVIATKP